MVCEKRKNKKHFTQELDDVFPMSLLTHDSSHSASPCVRGVLEFWFKFPQDVHIMVFSGSYLPFHNGTIITNLVQVHRHDKRFMN